LLKEIIKEAGINPLLPFLFYGIYFFTLGYYLAAKKCNYENKKCSSGNFFPFQSTFYTDVISTANQQYNS